MQVEFLERRARGDRLGLPQIVLCLTELFAALCFAIATDRSFSLAEKSIEERD